MELGAAAVVVAVTAESARLRGGAATRAPVQPPPHPSLGWRLGRTVLGVGRRMAEGGGMEDHSLLSPPPTPPPRSQGESEGERARVLAPLVACARSSPARALPPALARRGQMDVRDYRGTKVRLHVQPPVLRTWRATSGRRLLLYLCGCVTVFLFQEQS